MPAALKEESWKSLPELPRFRDLTLEDKPLLDLAFARFPPSISEFTFTNLFIWRECYQIRIGRFQNFICLFSEKGENSFFFPPTGEGNMIECYQTLLYYLRERGIAPRINRVPEEAVSGVDWKGGGIVVTLDRNQSDYVYLVNDLIQLQGRKYHRKRNHIKKFKEKYNYQYVPLTPERISECLELQTAWCDLRHCEVDTGLTNEFIAIKEAFTHFEALGVHPVRNSSDALNPNETFAKYDTVGEQGDSFSNGVKGGVILINGKVEAFTLGEPLNQETVVVHIEKANPDFDGLYPTLNQAFLQNHWSEYTFVNREQDLGEEGLRKAKESYFPHHRVNKYSLTLNE